MASSVVVGPAEVSVVLLEGARRELAEGFGLWSTGELVTSAGGAGLLCGWVESAVVFRVPVGARWMFPRFQFDGDLRPRPLMGAVLAGVGGALTEWDLALWFTTPAVPLGGARPVDVLTGEATDAEVAALLALAHSVGAVDGGVVDG